MDRVQWGEEDKKKGDKESRWISGACEETKKADGSACVCKSTIQCGYKQKEETKKQMSGMQKLSKQICDEYCRALIP